MPLRSDRELSFNFEFKELNDKGEFSGLASVYGVEDYAADVVVAGAFQKTLRERGNERPLLWLHRDPIGTVKLTDTATALQVDGKLTMEVQQAREAYALLKSGSVRGMSIGYQSIPDRTEFKGDKRYLHELRLHEVSLTPTPMLESAQVTQVKQMAQNEQISRALQEFRSAILGALEGRY